MASTLHQSGSLLLRKWSLVSSCSAARWLRWKVTRHLQALHPAWPCNNACLTWLCTFAGYLHAMGRCPQQASCLQEEVAAKGTPALAKKAPAAKQPAAKKPTAKKTPAVAKKTPAAKKFTAKKPGAQSAPRTNAKAPASKVC